jgi:hypothetical protein
MWYRLRETETIRPPATDALQLVSPALGFSLSRSGILPSVVLNPSIPLPEPSVKWNFDLLPCKGTGCLMIIQVQELMGHAR